MPEDKSLQIGIKTTADTAGLDQAAKGLDKVADKTKAAGDAARDSFEKEFARLDKLKEQAAKLKEEQAAHSAEVAKGAGKLKMLGAAATATAIAGKSLSDGFDAFSNAINDIDLEALRQVAPEFAAQTEAMKKSLETYQIYKENIIEGLLKTFTGSTMAESVKAFNQAGEDMRRVQAKIWRDSHDDRLESLRTEGEELDRQETTLRRMVELNREMAGIARTGAAQEVEWARLTGGDVALAEARAMSEQLNADLGELNAKIATAQMAARDATNKEAEAVAALNFGLDQIAAGHATAQSVGLAKLEKTAQDAGTKGEEARTKLAAVLTTSQGAQLNILRGAEINLAKAEQEYAGKTSAAANKAFAQFYNQIKAEVAKGPADAQQAIAQIQADAGAVTAAAITKAQEVAASMSAAGETTRQTVAAVGATAQTQTAAVDAAVNQAAGQVVEALNLLGDRIAANFAKIAAAVMAQNSKQSAQQAQINQLYARIR